MKNIYKIIIALIILVPTVAFGARGGIKTTELNFGAIAPTGINQGNGFINPLRIGDRIEAAYFIASSSVTKSTFPYASSTVISATGICISTDCRTAWPTGGGGSGGGTWSTTTSTVAGRLINYPNNTTDIPTIGSTSTTTAKFWFDPNTSIGFIRGNLGIGTTSPYAKLSVVGDSGVVAEKFTATSTTGISSFAGSVGLGTTSPSRKLEIASGDLSITSGNGQGRGIIFSTDTMDDTSRPNLKFLRNNFAAFLGDDHAAQTFSFMTALASTRAFSATVRAYGSETGGFANYAGLTHDGTNGSILTNTGNLVLSPATLKVGIGTSSPTTELNVAATLPEITLTDTDASVNQKHWFIEADSGVFSIGTTSDQLVKTANRPFAIGVTGNVGIGTSSPSARLDIYNTSNSNAGLYVEGGTTGVTIAQFARRSGSVADIKINASAGEPQMIFSANNTDGYTAGYDVSNSAFSISRGGVVGTQDSLVVKGTNVGIATSSPYAPLSVVGFGGIVTPNITATSTTATSTFAGGVDFRNATVQQKATKIFTIATTTAWTGTTTKQLGAITTLQTWNSATCYTTVGTLNIVFGDGTNSTNMIQASSTPATFALTTNNRFVAGSKSQVSIGTPTSSPVEISCTIDYTTNI